jgi:WD40 repeat protein
VSDASGVYSSADPWAGAPFASFPTLIGQRLSFMAAAVSPDGRWLATSTVIGLGLEDAHERREEVVTWDLHARRANQEIPRILATGLAFSTDSSRLLIAGADATDSWIQEWQLGAAAPDWKVTTTERKIWNAVYAPSGDGTIAVSLSDGIGIAHIGDERVSPVLAAGNAFPGIAFSPVDSGLLATSDPALWRIADGRAVWSVGKVATSEAASLADRWAAFSPDGQTLAASELHTTTPPPWDTSPHGMAGIVDTGFYRASDGQLLADAHGMLARRPSFSPDGRWVAAANQVANIASAATVQLPLTPAYQNASVSVFAPDGSVAVARDDGVIEIFCPK